MTLTCLPPSLMIELTLKFLSEFIITGLYQLKGRGTMIVVGGMIGAGKTTVATLIGQRLGSEVFYENVDDNPLLPLFYQEDEQAQAAKRYPFLLQLTFLSSRYRSIKQALTHENNVLDRSIYEDWYFCKTNKDLGRISELEFMVYEDLLANALADLASNSTKTSDLLVYLHGSFETIMYRIGLRGRDFEQDDALVDYYHTLWSGYDDWIQQHFTKEHILPINIDDYDFIHRPEDIDCIMARINHSLDTLRTDT